MTTQFNITITVGIEYDADGQELNQTFHDEGALTTHADSQVALAFGGFTRTEAKGAYRHADGHTVFERAHVYSILYTPQAFEPGQALSDAKRKAKAVAEILRRQRKQESVLVTVTETNAAFV